MLAFGPRIIGAAGVAVLLTVASVLAPTAGATATTPPPGALPQYAGYGGYGYYGLPGAPVPVVGDGAPSSSGAQQSGRPGYYGPYYGLGGPDYQSGNYPGSSTAAWYHFHLPFGLASPPGSYGYPFPAYPYPNPGTYTSPYTGSPNYYPWGASYAPVWGPMTGPSDYPTAGPSDYGTPPASAGGGSP